MTANDTRFEMLKTWLHEQLPLSQLTLKPASADASFRRYFRVWAEDPHSTPASAPDSIPGKTTYIAMDAPPENEDCQPFIQVAQLLQAHHINVPKLYAQDLEQGFLLLSDLGEIQYLSRLNNDSADKLYADALTALHQIQTQVPHTQQPEYDRALLSQEMQLFIDWFLLKHLGLTLSQQAQTVLADTFALLTDSALEQPKVFVHRDYHSRNLMVTAQNNPGILDFQDAMSGPVSYDLVSLMRDCYISWPEHQIEHWLKQYYAELKNTLPLPAYSIFKRWFDWMGIQRHLKATGIFARLNYRDNKPGYLQDIPRVMHYVFNISQQYPELQAFHQLLKTLSIKEKLQS